MNQPERNNQDEDFQELLRRIDSASAGQPPPQEPAPIYGEGRPLPPGSYALRPPLERPRVVWVLLALNIAIFIIPTVLEMLGVRVNGVPINEYILDQGAKDNVAIKVGGEYYRLLTAMFLHGGLLHILFNAYALYALGPEAERIYGTPRFLALYFIAGLAGGVASYAFSPNDSVGASGAIFGLIGGLAAFYYSARRLFGDIARRQLGSLITVIMINLFIGFSTPRIDNFAHIGGLIGGALVGWLLAPRFELDERRYPPALVRRGLPLAWPGALAFLGVLIFLVMALNPP